MIFSESSIDRQRKNPIFLPDFSILGSRSFDPKAPNTTKKKLPKGLSYKLLKNIGSDSDVAVEEFRTSDPIIPIGITRIHTNSKGQVVYVEKESLQSEKTLVKTAEFELKNSANNFTDIDYSFMKKIKFKHNDNWSSDPKSSKCHIEDEDIETIAFDTSKIPMEKMGIFTKKGRSVALCKKLNDEIAKNPNLVDKVFACVGGNTDGKNSPYSQAKSVFQNLSEFNGLPASFRMVDNGRNSEQIDLNVVKFKEKGFDDYSMIGEFPNPADLFKNFYELASLCNQDQGFYAEHLKMEKEKQSKSTNESLDTGGVISK